MDLDIASLSGLIDGAVARALDRRGAPRFVPATVVTHDVLTQAVVVILDGDTAQVTARSVAAGMMFRAGGRVMCAVSPPAGLLVVGALDYDAPESALERTAGFASAIMPATGFTASATYVNWPTGGAVTFPIEKLADATVLDVFGGITGYATGVAGYFEYALLIDGVDYLIARTYYNTLVAHQGYPLGAAIAGVKAGNYTATLRIRASGATANNDTNDWYTIRVVERRP